MLSKTAAQPFSKNDH